MILRLFNISFKRFEIQKRIVNGYFFLDSVRVYWYPYSPVCSLCRDIKITHHSAKKLGWYWEAEYDRAKTRSFFIDVWAWWVEFIFQTLFCAIYFFDMPGISSEIINISSVGRLIGSRSQFDIRHGLELFAGHDL